MHTRRYLCAIPAILILSFKAADAAVPEKPGWKAEWAKTVEAAKKEGQVTVYVTLGPHGIVYEFQKAFPDIKAVGVFGRSSDLVQRMLAERRAGQFLTDVRMGGGGRDLVKLIELGTAVPVKPLLHLPEVLDETKWWEGKHRYADAEGQYFFVFIGGPQPGSVYYNTSLVNPKEFHSFFDLLQPRWKGKTLVRDPRATGPGGGALRFLYHNPELGPKFLLRLFREMDITLTRDERLATDWLAQGRFAICFFCRGILPAKRQGLPVEAFGVMKEGAGISSEGGIVSVASKAPHPNAAKVFVNWLLSREGQIAYSKVTAQAEGVASDSLRIDIPKDNVSSEERRVEGVTYIDVDTPERRDMAPILKIIEDALAEAKK